MDETRKAVIRLKHWIDHNLDHLMGYKEVAALLEKEGYKEVVDRIREGITHVEKANSSFENALAKLEAELGALEPSEHDHHHH